MVVLPDYYERALIVVALEHGVTVKEMRGRSRHRQIVVARRAACVALRGLGMSLQGIGNMLGARDHTTILHHLRVVRDGVARLQP